MPENSRDNLIPAIDVNAKVDAVVVGYDNMISLPKLVKACTYASRVHPSLFIATNTDETFPTPSPDLLVPGTGSFVNFVKTAVGREPVVMGKPNASYWDAVKRVYPDIDAKRTLMIGDRLNTDIAFANSNGLGFSLLVESGVHSLSDAEEAVNDHERHHLVPSHYLPCLSDLIKHLK